MAGLPPSTRETARAMAMEARASQERLERVRREEEEKRRREKSEMLEREKAEKERQERHDKEEQERLEAVRQHFEESLHLGSQKTCGSMMSVAQNPHLDSPEAGCIQGAGWSPIVNLPYPKAPAATTSSSAVITQPEKQWERQELDHHENRYSVEARMRQVADQERRFSMVQQQQEQQQQQQRLDFQAQAPAHHRISHAEQLKPKLDIHARSSPKTYQMLPGSNLSQQVGSSVPSTSSVTVATSRGEPSFNLSGYQPFAQPSFNLSGYQPFAQMYITQAQFKAREESKSHHSQPTVNRQPLVSSPFHFPRIERDLRLDRSSTPGGQRGSPKPPVKDRVSPAMSTPGTFRPCEYNSAGPSPAHQGSLARCPTSFPREEAQNLVKGSRSRQDSPLSTPSPWTTSYSSGQPAKATQPYSYSLIQQGLVPSPLYTPATPTTWGSELVPPGGLQSGSKRRWDNSESDSDAPPEEGSKKKKEPPEMIAQEQGTRPKGLKHHVPADESPTMPRKKQGRSADKPTVAQLNKIGQTFLQHGSCFDVDPKLPKCRECRRVRPNQRNEERPDNLCRFNEFRKLKYSRTGKVVIAGFSEPGDAVEEDVKLWLPVKERPSKDSDVATAKIILAHVGDRFCDLVRQEKEAQSLHMGESRTIAWKRVVKGVREMCDVCETTLFNIHWVCHKCGFVVCLDCYRARKDGTVRAEKSPAKDRDKFRWLLCPNRAAHKQEKLMMTQIIAGTALWDVCRQLHETRTQWGIPSYCGCSAQCNSAQRPDKNGSPPNDVCTHLTSMVEKTFSAEECSAAMNNVEASSSSPTKRTKRAGNGNVSSEDEDSSALSVLADIALRLHISSEMDEEEQSKGNSEEEDFSALLELPMRPIGAAKKMVVDEVGAVAMQQAMGGQHGEEEREQQPPVPFFCHLWPPMHRALPERFYSHGESSALHSGAPHSWCCGGRLLVLHEPRNNNNLALFQEQWKRGQPVLVTDVCENLNKSLWHPDGFCRDFGEMHSDLVNCRTGNILLDQPMRKFWEGFENLSKRMRDIDGKYMLLKLKDWPPEDDFRDMLPTRFSDLMNVLPLPNYTHRDGVFNLAGRLPDCFVRPDLGPKMYTAYGSALYPNIGTTNLHLDVSDAVNLMVYVGIPKDGKAQEQMAALQAISKGWCDTLTQKRVSGKNAEPGALWHIYDARDADKIRDLLHKVAKERGDKLEPHHDPIHDQSWYLNKELRRRLFDEYRVKGYTIVQFQGDAIFIPAGAPHQVLNLHSCIKVAEDFVSPENVAHCVRLTNEFRQLSNTHNNHEDKLQIKNVIYHAVKDALITLTANK